MSPTERRQIPELVAMYELEPEIRDVYVEGTFDRALVEWLLYEAEAKKVVVREIDSIDIPPDLIEGYGFAKNSRGRVMTLARELESDLEEESRSATCLIDTDFDLVLGNSHGLRLLLSTDYCSMELYFFDVRTLAKFLTLVVQRFPKRADTVLSEIREALKDLFAIRLALHLLNWTIPMISFERCCRLTATGVELDKAEYISRLLNAGNRHAERSEFSRRFEECRRRLTGDPRNHIHGHDFLSILAWYVRQHGRHRVSEEILTPSILACADSALLRNEPMFRQLLERVS